MMSAGRNSRLHDSVWEGVRRAIEDRERVRAGWRAAADGIGLIETDAGTAQAIARDLAWTGETILEA